MGNNIQKLGEVLSNRMTKTAGAAVPTTIELGTISSNMSLITDSLKSPIPRGDYMVDITLACDTYQTTEVKISGTTSGSISTDDLDSILVVPEEANAIMLTSEVATVSEDDVVIVPHDHRLPKNFRGLEPGDRVLVAWCGYEPVVIAIVTSS